MESLAGCRLDGKVVVVTGAASGLGLAVARRVVDAGARVVATDVRHDALDVAAAGLGDAAVLIRQDVAREDDWDAVMRYAEKAFGGLDLLVNNAGNHHSRTIEEETVDGFRQHFDVHLLGTFLGIRAAIAPMRARGGGSIVNVSSFAGFMGVTGQASYSSMKWAVRGLTRTAAIELGPDNIRVNSVHPGSINPATIEPQRVPRARSPMQRMVTAREVADVVLFLGSDMSSFVSGAELAVDGAEGAGLFVPGLGSRS
jgi:3alpha(or 20beta)-hydroxysteroid dehydrogenase